MTDIIRHRGPDDEGFYIDSNLGLGFRRLSILDLSPGGHQPMSDQDGSFWIVFNGEIYNYIELREELKSMGHVFTSQSDTEVIIASYREWGYDCVNRFNGMWAFAIWNKKKRELFCARDRFGVKPFYYFKDRETFIFGSEMKSILLNTSIDRTPNDRIIFNYCAIAGRDWSDETFFKNINQLEPGHYLVITGGQIIRKKYYDVEIKAGNDNRNSDDFYVGRFYELFEDSVRLRLRSDVPIGSCLSGGLDSSSIVCMINKLLKESKVSPEMIGSHQKTFSAYSENPLLDERIYMDAVLAQTGAGKNAVLPTAQGLSDELDQLLWHHEEPFISSSMYAQYCVMRLAHAAGIKVLLDGQGADEMLGGYDHAYYPYFTAMLRRFQWIKAVKHNSLLKQTGKPLSFGAWGKIGLGLLPRSMGNYFYKRLTLTTSNSLNKNFIRSISGGQALQVHAEQNLKKKLLHDFRYNLRMLLMYEDKNSMAFSIEARVPFLDYRLVEFVFSLPDDLIVRNAERKYVLRRAVNGLVPDKIRNRKDKIGFATAEREWITGSPLRQHMSDIFHSASFAQRGYLDAGMIIQSFDDLIKSPERKSHINFWACFLLEMWLRKFIDQKN